MDLFTKYKFIFRTLYSHTWSSSSIAMAYIGYIVWLINCDPKFHFVPKTAKDEVSIIPEFGYNCFILPASNILKSLWKVPVVESDLAAKKMRI